MTITTNQLATQLAAVALHGIGDYLTQSDWMAQNKTKQHLPALCHALVYSSLFWLLRPSLVAWLVILNTHFLIDRYRLARYVVWAKNWMGPKRYWWKIMDTRTGAIEWEESTCMVSMLKVGSQCECFHQPTPPWRYCSETGYPPNRPAWLTVWLLIIADNIIHVCINAGALAWL